MKTVPVKERKQQRVGSKIMFNLILRVIMMYHWQKAWKWKTDQKITLLVTKKYDNMPHLSKLSDSDSDYNIPLAQIYIKKNNETSH
jgi:hypothetical protein